MIVGVALVFVGVVRVAGYWGAASPTGKWPGSLVGVGQASW